jgi:cob(I)alamin adenosyltransferase
MRFMATDVSELLAPWIAEHCARQAAERVARAERRKAERAARKAARDAGLKQRHARKLERLIHQGAGFSEL